MKEHVPPNAHAESLALVVARALATLAVVAGFFFALWRGSGYLHDWTEHGGQGHMVNHEQMLVAAGAFVLSLAVRGAFSWWARKPR